MMGLREVQTSRTYSADHTPAEHPLRHPAAGVLVQQEAGKTDHTRHTAAAWARVGSAALGAEVDRHPSAGLLGAAAAVVVVVVAAAVVVAVAVVLAAAAVVVVEIVIVLVAAVVAVEEPALRVGGHSDQMNQRTPELLAVVAMGAVAGTILWVVQPPRIARSLGKWLRAVGLLELLG